MSKPTINQQKLLSEIGKYITWIGETNDIDSPSHNNLIDEFIRHDLFNYGLEHGEEIILDTSIRNILTIVRRHK
jgi:hypothetical protein